MKILVTYATRHGSTRDIADAIAGELRASQPDVDLREAGKVDAIEGYDAAVLGSAVYLGNWLRDARRFADRHQARLASIPVWLFSSGPLGDEVPTQEWEPRQIPHLMEATRARGHRMFKGKLDRSKLGLFERFIVRRVRAPEGDFRDWDSIRGWAREIAAALGEKEPGGPAPGPQG